MTLCQPPKPALRIAGLALLPLVAGGCRRGPADRPGGAESPPVVIISIDTLRSDHMPAYGYRGVETPAIDGLRRDSILFERAYAHVPLTLPSPVSLLSGQLPTVHGVRDNAGYRVPAAGPWLSAALLVYRESLQVPLLVKLPGGERAGSAVAEPVQLADVYPTVARLAGLPRPEGLPGAPLPGLTGEVAEAAGAPPRRIYAESYYQRFHFGWSELLTLIEGRHQYIQAPEPELYDLVADPAGRSNRLLADRRRAGTLRRALAAEVREPAPPSAVDEETRRSLAALGYAAGGTDAGPGRDLPDPKRRIHTLAGMRTAFGLFRQSRFADAVPAFQAALADNPRLLEGWDYLGRALQAAIALDPGQAAAHESLGLVLLRLGRFPEARDSSRRAVEIDPGRVHAWNNLGTALYRSGDRDGAFAAWEQAVAIDPRQFDTLYNLGARAAEAGRLDEARRALRQFAAPPERYAAELAAARALLRQLDPPSR